MTDTALDDAQIVEASLREPERFAVLFHRYAPELGRYIGRRLGREAVDDLVAETFLVAFRRRAAYDLERPDAKAWLYGIATNVMHRHRRTEARRLRALQRTGFDPVLESFCESVEARVTAGAVSRELAAAIARLSAGQRDVLLLVAWADLTYDQVAEALGVPSGTVRSRMNRVRARLREAFGGTDPTNAQEATYG